MTHPANNGYRAAVDLALNQVGGRGDFVGDRNHRHLQGASETVDASGVIIEHGDAGGADRDIGDTKAPWAPQGVGDDDG